MIEYPSQFRSRDWVLPIGWADGANALRCRAAIEPYEAVMTDRLTLAHALENGGISRDAAEHIATEIFDAIHDNVATKTDVRETETRLQAKHR